MVVLTDYNSNIPVIRPQYIAENIANKKNDLLNPNTTGYTSTLAVYNAITGITTNSYTKSEINYYTGKTVQHLNIIDSGLSWLSGNTTFNFVGSGTTVVSTSGIDPKIIYIYAPSGATGVLLQCQVIICLIIIMPKVKCIS